MLSAFMLLSVCLMFGCVSPVVADAEEYSQSSNRNTQVLNHDPLEATSQTATSLLGSITYGPWLPEYSTYNCYAFALGRKYQRYIIGDFSDQSCFVGNQILPVLQLADIVYDDLQALGYQCIKLERNTFSLPSNGQNLICLRASDDTFEDFHFMKFSNNVWLHKPGTTWVLQYSGTPSASVPWYREGVDAGGNVLRIENSYYDGDIYFFSYKAAHAQLIYSYHDTSTHLALCEDCMTGNYEPHDLQPYGDKYMCAGCYAIFTDDGYGSVILGEEDEKEIY